MEELQTCRLYKFGQMRFLRLMKCCGPRSCLSSRVVVVVIIISLTLIASLLHVLSISTALFCLNFKTKNAIRDLCAHYEAGQVAGNLCEDLCHHEHHFAVTSCYIPHLAKDVVFTAQWRRRTVVVKARHDNLAAYDPFPYSTLTGPEHQVSLQEFLVILREVISVNFDANFEGQHLLWEDSFIPTLLSGYPSPWTRNQTAKTDQKLRAVLRSIWLLAQQKEFLTFKLFQSSGMFPSIYGSCGHFYAMEHVTPASAFARAGWHLRAELVLGILKLLETAEYRFPYALRICDMKLSHFGMDGSRNVKLLDGDDLYFQDVLNKIVCYQSSCGSDHDCAFFDCDMSCDLRNRTCDSSKVNTNLQAACRKLFSHSHSFSPGLLHSPKPHLKGPLDETLKACIASTNADLAFLKLKNEIADLLHSSD